MMIWVIQTVLNFEILNADPAQILGPATLLEAELVNLLFKKGELVEGQFFFPSMMALNSWVTARWLLRFNASMWSMRNFGSTLPSTMTFAE